MIARVEDISASQFSAVIKRRSFSSILIGGGSPCQGNTSLNSRRQGMGDSRGNQPQLLSATKLQVELCKGFSYGDMEAQDDKTLAVNALKDPCLLLTKKQVELCKEFDYGT